MFVITGPGHTAQNNSCHSDAISGQQERSFPPSIPCNADHNVWDKKLAGGAGRGSPLGATEGCVAVTDVPGTSTSSSSPASSSAISSPSASASAVGEPGGSSVAISSTGGPREPVRVLGTIRYMRRATWPYDEKGGGCLLATCSSFPSELRQAFNQVAASFHAFELANGKPDVRVLWIL